MSDKNFVAGDTLKAKETGGRYIVKEINGEYVTICHSTLEIKIDILHEDVPELFENLRTDV